MEDRMEITTETEPAGPILQDLEGYISNYTGHTRISRLRHLAVECPQIRREAYRLAIADARKGQNTALYCELVDACNENGEETVQKDDAWIVATDKQSKHTLQKLDNELNTYKSNLIKESIRMAYNDLAVFHYERGDLTAALKCYYRSKDYCAHAGHMLTLCTNIIKVCLEKEDYIPVLEYVSKAEQQPDKADKQPLLNVAAGLAHLSYKRYKLAARKFLDSPFPADDSASFSSIMSPTDVAAFGALCGLATFDRKELHDKVIASASFKDFLEYFPEVRELVTDFYNSRYASCLAYLEKIKQTLRLDIYFHSHLNEIYSLIHRKALVQYVLPYVSVNMHRMAEAFHMDVTALEKNLADLIMSEQIKAKIDSHKKVLHARHADQRSSTFQEVLRASDAYEDGMKNLLLRVNFLRKLEPNARKHREQIHGMMGHTRAGRQRYVKEAQESLMQVSP